MRTIFARISIFAALLLILGCQQDRIESAARQSTSLNGPTIGGREVNEHYVLPPPPPSRTTDTARPGDDYTRKPPTAPKTYTPPAQAFAAAPKGWYPAVRPRAWKYIVIHHSDTEIGSAASFDRYHRQVHHWKELGYDFVIDNGHGAADGLVEVGPRWTNQETGAHAGVLEYNEWGIGICLVGNFQTAHPTAAQLRSLARLNHFLMLTYHIPASHIITHREAKGGKTTCPGRNLSIVAVRAMATRLALGEDSLLGEALAILSR